MSTYTVWIAWNKPIKALVFPPKGQLPFDWNVNQEKYIACTDGMFAVVGNLSPFERCITFVNKREAEALANRIPGAYVETK